MSHRPRHSSERERDREDRDRDRSHRSSKKEHKRHKRDRHRDKHRSRKASRRERSRDRSSDRSSDRSWERSRDRRDRSRDRYRDRSHDRSRDRSHDRSRDRSYDRKHYDRSRRSESPATASQPLHNELPETSHSHGAMGITAEHVAQYLDSFDAKRQADAQHADGPATPDDAVDGAASAPAEHVEYVDAGVEQPAPFDPVAEEEKERIQRETYVRLQQYLVTEGKSYPAPKAQASHPIFANDGSFLETFKSLQGQMQQQQELLQPAQPEVVKPKEPAAAVKEVARAPPTIKRRGGKILKTGVVRKQRIVEDADDAESQPKDSWSAYLKEVKRYKNVTCSEENMTRSLVK